MLKRCFFFCLMPCLGYKSTPQTFTDFFTQNFSTYTRVYMVVCMVGSYGTWDILVLMLPINAAYVTCQKEVCRVWSFPAATHCCLLPVICDSIPLIDVLFSKSANFINSCLRSDNLPSVLMSNMLYIFVVCIVQWEPWHLTVVCVMAYVQGIY